MKKIIVPVDFSEHSEYALEVASMLAKKNNAEILALHMLEISDAVINKADNMKQMESLFFIKLAEQKFEEFLNKEYLKDIKVTPIIKHFKVFHEVNEIAKENNADLIVMGSQGASGMKEVLVGSNTEKVVRYSEIPVLIIKHNPILMDFESMVFACDFTEEAIQQYNKAKEMAIKLGSKIHLVYVNLPGTKFRSSVEIEKQVATFLRKADGGIEKMNEVNYVNDYTIEQGILNFSNIIGADLITVATHGRKGIAHFFEGSITEDITNHSTLPVMTFKI